RLGHISFPAIIPARRRYEGYRDALSAHGLAFDDSLVAEGTFLQADAEAAMRVLLQRSPRPSAVFVANDPMAIGAMKAVWDAGLRIPEDIAIVGAGNIIPGDMLRGPRTTVTGSRNEMGPRAAELLLQQLADPTTPP